MRPTVQVSGIGLLSLLLTDFVETLHLIEIFPDASSTMRALWSARYTVVRLYTLQIKICTRTTRAHEHSHC